MASFSDCSMPTMITDYASSFASHVGGETLYSLGVNLLQDPRESTAPTVVGDLRAGCGGHHSHVLLPARPLRHHRSAAMPYAWRPTSAAIATARMDRIPATGTCGTGRPASLGPGSRQAGTRIEAENATRCTIDYSVGEPKVWNGLPPASGSCWCRCLDPVRRCASLWPSCSRRRSPSRQMEGTPCGGRRGRARRKRAPDTRGPDD